MKVAIFGINGQDGRYLETLCKRKGVEVVGVSRTGTWVQGDVSHYDEVEELVKRHLPDYIFNFAAASTTRHEFLFENHATISTGALNVLEAVRRHARNTRVFLAGSGLQFRNTGEPISESDEFAASSPYAVARIHSVYSARYFRSLGIKVYVGYLFHHESPLRKETHVSQMIARAVRRIAAGSGEIITLGDISVEKEWTFAGDVVKGIMTLVEQDDVYEAAIGSGVGYTIKDWLEQCFAVIGKDWRDHVVLREGFCPEYRCLVSKPQTIRALGWTPEVSLPDLARMMVTDL